MLQGYEESDFEAKSTHQIFSWQDTITTLVKLSEPQPEPTDEELLDRLHKLKTT